MITDAILTWIMDLFDWAMSGWFGDMVMPNPDFAFIGELNYFIPIAEMFTLFLAFFALGGPMVATSILVWLLVGVLRGGQAKI